MLWADASKITAGVIQLASCGWEVGWRRRVRSDFSSPSYGRFKLVSGEGYKMFAEIVIRVQYGSFGELVC